jgi:hypothetical protein
MSLCKVCSIIRKYDQKEKGIVTCMVVHATNKTGSISDDWIY